MSFEGKLSFQVCGFDVGVLEPYHLVFREGVRRGVRSLLFHDFRDDFESSSDLCLKLVEGFYPVFNGWYSRGQGEWGKEFRLESIPYFKGQKACSAVGTDVMGELCKQK